MTRNYKLKSAHQVSVEEFMYKAGQEVPSTPTMPSLEIRRLRAKLILEECLETIDALGFVAEVLIKESAMGMTEPILVQGNNKPNLVEIIDGCCDIKVVTTGTLSACGLPDDPFQYEVDSNNLSKFGPGHSIREDGKLVKPPGHQPPAIQETLEAITNEAYDD